MREQTLVDRRELVAFLRANNLVLAKKLGQNFLVDANALAKIIAAADLKKTDTIVEIGAGVGTLTRELAARAQRVIACEIDATIFPALQKNLAGYQNVELQNVDVRKFRPPAGEYKLIANIPYYLTSPILRQFFVETSVRPQRTVLLVQKEVAAKICDSQKLSILALEVRVFATAEIVATIARESFWPPPKVESAILKIVLKKNPEVEDADLPDFFKIVHAGFRAPRKKIRGSFAAGFAGKKAAAFEILKAAKIDESLRPEDLKITDWLALLASARRFTES